MNNFELHFYSKFLPEWHEIQWIVHKHIFEIFWKLFFWISIAILPAFVYYVSIKISTYVPFYVLEIFLIILYIKIIYDIFDWYNDVFIVTNKWVIDFRWWSFKQSVNLIDYGWIEWIEVEQSWFLDSMFKKWNLILHKSWDDKTVLENAFNPFKWANLIEELSDWIDIEDDSEKTTEERFNMLINTLWWLMEWYVDKTKPKEDDHTEVIEKYKTKDWTINLRD